MAEFGRDHKVVLVLDHGPRFGKDSASDVPISLKDTGSTELRQVAVMKKTLWTWCVEGTLDLHRVVSDLFSGNNRLLRVALSDSVGRMLIPEWEDDVISQQTLIRSLSKVGGANCSDDVMTSSSMSGLIISVEALSQRTPLQRKWAEERKNQAGHEPAVKKGPRPFNASKTAGTATTHEGKSTPPPNRGSIVLFTSFTSEDELSELEKEVDELIVGRNKIVGNLKDENLLQIDHVDLFIINMYPANAESAVTSKQHEKLTAHLSRSLVSRPAGEQLISAVHSVCISLYDLLSTTVSGIPMKEDAQQRQSVNYDVELLHPRAAHKQLEALGLVGDQGFLRDMVENTPYPTYRLAWATPSPKSRWNLFPRTRSALRVTPCAVNSRPSVCLTSFLLQGRNVMLEVARKGPAEPLQPNVNQKLISHTLIAHAGRIYIHAIDIGPIDILDNIPDSDTDEATEDSTMEADDVEAAENTAGSATPSEKSGPSMKKEETEESEEEAFDEDEEALDELGQRTLRVADFCQLIHECTLAPPDSGENSNTDKMTSCELPCAQPIRQLRRLTRYWPLYMEQSVIYQIPKRFEPLLSVMRRNELSTADVDKCKQVIYRLAALKDSNEMMSSQKLKTVKLVDPMSREEQYRVAVSELASHLGNYVNHSERHLEVFNMYMQTMGIDRSVNISVNDVAVTDLDKIPIRKPAPTTSASMSPVSVDIVASSRSNSPLPKKRKTAAQLWKPNEVISVYEMMCGAEERRAVSEWKDFVGRVEAGSSPAQLYKELDLTKAEAL